MSSATDDSHAGACPEEDSPRVTSQTNPATEPTDSPASVQAADKQGLPTETSGQTAHSNETADAQVAGDTPGRPPLAQHDASILDLAFAMDCTGSMGRYIRKAQQSIRGIVEEIVALEKSDIRLALVEYRDHPPEDRTFVTRVMDFTPHVTQMKQRLDACAADGGGDNPEAVADALQEVSNLSWREVSTKICVFISDAPPHGLCPSEDHSFPKGCPDGIDPIKVATTLAKKGITMYMVGCEPPIIPYKDFFMTIAHMTGGQYVPLENASQLSKVIAGGAIEEITLERLLETTQQEVQRDLEAIGGWGEYLTNEDDIADRVMGRLNARGGFKVQQLQYNRQALPAGSSRAKRWANMSTMEELVKDFHADDGLVMDVSAKFSGDRSSYLNRIRGRGKKGKKMPPGCLPKGAGPPAITPELVPGAPEPAATEGRDEDKYLVVESTQIDKEQTKRLLNRLRMQNI